jgi:FMN-dependent NADH-azoreductase
VADASDPAAVLGSQMLEEFLAADVVVIGAPMYNFSIPSQLKAWIDRVAVAGKTFRYTANGPEGLAGGKRIIIASSRGGVYSEGSAAAPMDFQETYLRAVFGFLGVTDFEFVRAEGVNLSEDNKVESLKTAHASIGVVTRKAA